jgi:dTDP-glucose 4,6-dehydratase
MICGLTGRKLRLDGGGKARKSYLHADDLSKAIMAVIERGEIGEVYNVGPDAPTPIREVVALCLGHTQASWKDIVEEGPERVGQDSCYWLNSDKIKDLGWKQEIDWDKGLRRIRTWLEDYPELLGMPTDFVMRA